MKKTIRTTEGEDLIVYPGITTSGSTGIPVPNTFPNASTTFTIPPYTGVVDYNYSNFPAILRDNYKNKNKCDSCKKTKNDCFYKYSGVKLQRTICTACFAKAMDTFFGIKGRGADIEEALYE